MPDETEVMMDNGVPDRRLREIEAEISQLERRLGIHQVKAAGIMRKLSRLTDKRKSLVKKRACRHRSLKQTVVNGNIAFVCADCDKDVLEVPSSERDLHEEAQNRLKALG